MRIFILDEIVVSPGRAGEYRLAYRDRYVPGAMRRGMRLDGAWQSPAGMEYDELPVTLYYLWSVENSEAWWKMRLSRDATGADERFEKLAWWQESDRMTIGRKRSTLTAQPSQD